MQPAPPPAPRVSAAATLVLPAFVLLVGLLATGVAALSLRDLSRTRDRERFARLATGQVDDIDDRMATYLALLRGAAGLYAADAEVSRAQFAVYFARLRVAALYPGLQGIGYARRFEVGARAALLADLRAQGFGEVRLRPEPEGPTATAIAALEPLDPRNAGALGYDMYSEPTRRAAMARARDTGEAALTARTELVQEAGQPARQPGFLIYLPVYADGAAPETAAARQERLRGWVYAPFRAGDFFAHVTLRPAPGRAPELAYRVYDGEGLEAGHLLYASPQAPPADAPALTRHLEVAGRTWTLVASPTGAFAHDPNADLWPPVALLGGGATLLLAGATLAQARARRRSEQARLALEEETARLERLNRTGAALVAERDLGRLVQIIIDAATSLTGASAGAFVARGPDAAPGVAPPPPGRAAEGVIERAADGIVRVDDLAAGAPEAAGGARSYLSVPVASRSGERLGALLFEHPRPAVFGEREERLAVGFAAQAAVALDNARLFASVSAGRDRAELLLREVNHRVANSLALVAALARMQANAVADPAAKAALREMEARVSAIAGIHRRLYTSQDVEAVEVDAYLASLVEELQAAMQATGRDHAIRLEVEPVRLATDKAVSVGVVVTELVTNAYKYAYGPGTRGEIRVALRRHEPDRLELAVEDDGVGWSGQGEPRGTGLGSRIVRAMAANLQSGLVYATDRAGTRAVLAFRA